MHDSGHNEQQCYVEHPKLHSRNDKKEKGNKGKVNREGKVQKDEENTTEKKGGEVEH